MATQREMTAMATAAKTRDARRRTGAGKAQADRGGQVQSLVRALAIMNALAEADDGASLTDIAQQVGIPVSTAHRLLTTLQQERYVRFDAERTLWSIGMQAFVVGNGFVRTRNLIQIARPHMRQLMLDSGETVNLGVEDKGEAIYLAQIECRQMMRALATPGERVPLHCSGVGKALLAAMPENRRSGILQKHGMQRYTDMTITTPAALRDELARTAERGYAVDDEEHAIGLRCAASVIFDEAEEPIAAISMSGPKARIANDRIAVLGDLVRRVAAAITAEYGGRTRPLMVA